MAVDDTMDLDEIAQPLCERLGIGKVTEIHPLHRGYENFNCRLRTATGEFVLRRYLEQPFDRILNEHRVLHWLTGLGYPAVPPMSDKRGESIFRGTGCARPWAVFPFVAGGEPESAPDTASVIGGVVGRLHALPDPAWAGWAVENVMSPRATVELVRSVKFKMPERCGQLGMRFEALIKEIVPGIRALELPSGLIHGDVFPDNTLFIGRRLVAVLDFGQLCRDAYLFDVAMTLHGFCLNRDNTICVEAARAFLLAYETARALTGEEKSALHLYLRWCPLAMAGWHYGRFLENPNTRQGTRIGELLASAECHYSTAEFFPEASSDKVQES